MKVNLEKIRSRIENALQFSGGYSKKEQQDIAFHMTDWLDDFSKLSKFYQFLERYKPEDIEKLLMDFLVHVPNHVAAAAKLMTQEGVSDIFDVGATKKIIKSKHKE